MPTLVEKREANQEQVVSFLKEGMDFVSEKMKNGLYLTGGTAVAVYAGLKRPPSLDLDFFVEPEKEEEVVGYFDGTFRIFSEKPLFKSRKMVSKTPQGVDLDFILQQDIVPDENRPDKRISLKVDDFMRNHVHTAHWEGMSVSLMPPEIILISKLFAGRGSELKKFDLKDSESLIEADTIDQYLFGQLIAQLIEANSEIASVLLGRLASSLQKIQHENPSDKVMSLVRFVSMLQSRYHIKLIG